MPPALQLPVIALILTFGVVAAAGSNVHTGTAARAEFTRGMQALTAGRIDVARQAFSEAVALAPEWGLAYLQWGIVEQSVDPKATIARECLQTAVELAPGNPRAHYHLGVLYEGLDVPLDAMREYRAALQLRPRMRDVQFRLATVLSEIGEQDAAILTFRDVLDQQPGHTGALTALAELFEKTNRIEDAEQALVAITRTQPRVAYHHYRLGQFYERVGKQSAARQAFARADWLDPRPTRKMRRLR